MICIPPRQKTVTIESCMEKVRELRKFWTHYSPTLGNTVSRLVGVERPLACFQIHRAAIELAPFPATLVPGLLILSDDAKRPLVAGHCVVECQKLTFDFAFTGPASYGLACDIVYEFHPYHLRPEKQFSDLPDHVVENLEHGVDKAEQWWRSLGCVDRKSLMAAIQHCANGGNIIVEGEL